MKFTKKECIKAVLTEPLKLGSWNSEDNKTCSVCAVGAILRQHNINNSSQIDRLMNINSSRSSTQEKAINIHIKNGKYLHALSCFFENLGSYNLTTQDWFSAWVNAPSKEGKWALVHFIEAFFPDSFEYKG